MGDLNIQINDVLADGEYRGRRSEPTRNPSSGEQAEHRGLGQQQRRESWQLHPKPERLQDDTHFMQYKDVCETTVTGRQLPNIKAHLSLFPQWEVTVSWPANRKTKSRTPVRNVLMHYVIKARGVEAGLATLLQSQKGTFTLLDSCLRGEVNV